MKKLVSLTLALLLCVGMLAGCSGSNNNGGDAAGDGIIKLAVSSDITSLTFINLGFIVHTSISLFDNEDGIIITTSDFWFYKVGNLIYINPYK